jgi:DNA-binding NarL/FixJ family response regulator
MSISIVIVDDHKIMRDGLRNILDNNSDNLFEIIAEADNGREAVKIILDKKPDIVIMDIGMPEMNGIEATRQIIKDLPNIKIIALSMHYDMQFVTGMLKAGAKGYLLKDCAGSELVLAIITVQKGNNYICQDITNSLIDDFSKNQSHDQFTNETKLTNRENEILQLLTEGNTTKQIARDLFISVKTVEAHRANIMHKLEIRNLPDLTKYAIRKGLTSLDK